MIRKPAFRLLYNGRDITGDLASWPTSIRYEDKRHGESDEISITVHNATGAWLDDWAPADGDLLSLDYGYDDELVPAGIFTLDEWSADGSRDGDVVDIRALSAPKTASLRTTKSVAYEKESLADIVGRIAAAHGLSVEGEIEDITFDRISQNGERDLEFLRRLADDYGHFFKVTGGRLVFTSRDGLRARDPVREIDRLADNGQDLKSYRLRWADHEAAASAKVSYDHPQKKRVIAAEATSVDDLGLMTASGDILKVKARVESEGQARRLVDSRLDQRNSRKVTGEMTLVGDPKLVAGQVVALVNFGVFSGRVLIESASHYQDRGGYETTIRFDAATDKRRAKGRAGKAGYRKAGQSASPGPTDGVDDLGRIDGSGRISR